MSDIASLINVLPAALPAHPQLPVAAYFDEALFEREKRALFDAGPGYVGHQLMVPELHDYRTLPAFAHGRMLSRQADGVYLMSNVCRHRQALMLNGHGNARHIVCPIHRWTYDAGGELLGAPHFPENPCLHLEKERLTNWQGLLFRGPRSAADDLAGMAVAGEFDFTGYRLDRVEEHLCHYNWKTFIEVYLEDYHVAPFHPGLGQFVSCDDLRWQFGDGYSVQRVGVTSLARAGSPAYAAWQRELLRYGQASGQAPRQGALWLTYFPNVMVEWYPQVLVVSTLTPLDVQKTLNVVEFYYPEDVACFERELVAAEQAAYLETAREDDEIGERMDRGRLALLRAGRNETGPYQSPLEDGMRHFHEFYRRCLGDALDRLTPGARRAPN